MFSKRSHKENAELTERFSISENVLVNIRFTWYSPFGKIDGERGFSSRARSFTVVAQPRFPP